MPNLLFFSRNRCSSVEQMDEKTVRSSCRLQDTLTDASVEIFVKLPDLELADVRAEVRRSRKKIEADIAEALRKAVGVRIGPGMVKILKGLIGDREDLEELLVMVEECCQAIILSFTKGELSKAPKEAREAKDFYIRLLKENVRLYNSCVAFAPDSPLVEGFVPPEK